MRYTTTDRSADDLDIIGFAKELREFIDNGNMSVQIDIHTNDGCERCDKCISNTVNLEATNLKADVLKKLAQEYGAEFIYDVANHVDILMKDPRVFEEVFRVFVANYMKNPHIGKKDSFSLRDYIGILSNENKRAIHKSSESSCWDRFCDTKGYKYT